MKCPRFHSLALLLVAVLMTSGCKSMLKQLDQRTGQAKLIGTIEMVNPEQHYVLINCDQRSNLEAGTELIVLDASGTKSKVVVTPERKGTYLTADIKEGTPAVSSLVLQKIRESDTLPPQPPPPGAAAAAHDSRMAESMTPEITNSTGSLPLIPPVEFPRGGATMQPAIPPAPSGQAPALPKLPASPPPAANDAPDLSKLPPVVR